MSDSTRDSSVVVHIGGLSPAEQALVRALVDRHGGSNPRLREMIRRECRDVIRRHKDYPRSFSFLARTTWARLRSSRRPPWRPLRRRRTSTWKARGAR